MSDTDGPLLFNQLSDPRRRVDAAFVSESLRRALRADGEHSNQVGEVEVVRSASGHQVVWESGWLAGEVCWSGWWHGKGGFFWQSVILLLSEHELADVNA